MRSVSDFGGNPGDVRSQLCLSAQIHSEKLRAYLWLCERGEIKHIFDDAGTVVPFLRTRGQSTGTQHAENSEASSTRRGNQKNHQRL